MSVDLWTHQSLNTFSVFPNGLGCTGNSKELSLMVIFDRIRRTHIGNGSHIEPQPMVGLGMRGGGFFIEFYAKPQSVGRIHEAILEFHFLVDHILAPRHIVEQRFMYAVAGSGNAKRKRNGIRHGARRIMRIEVKVWHAKKS